MAKENNFLGIESFKLGSPGDGVMGSELIDFFDIEDKSVSIEGGDQNHETIATENDDSYLRVATASTPLSVNARLLGVTIDQLILLKGGEVDEATGEWKSPKSATNIYLSLEIKGKEIKGKRGVLCLPYASVNARFQGNITKDSVLAVDLTLTASTPVSSSGVKGSPYSYNFKEVALS